DQKQSGEKEAADGRDRGITHQVGSPSDIEYWNLAVPNADPLDAKCGSRSCSNRNAMDLEDLRTFVEVADAGGVAPGARRLGVSKSIVSRRLARLEEALGVQLLSRTTRGSGL